MKYLRIQFILMVMIALISVSACELLSTVEEEAYPLKLKPLPLDSLQSMNQRYHSINNNHLCSTLNEFGYTGFSRVLFPNDINPCLERERVRIEMQTSDSLVLAAKGALLKNQEFTGVQDSSRLRVSEIKPLYGCTICEGQDVDNKVIEYKITFQDQMIDTIRVRNTSISVFIDAEGVNRIWGNWYAQIAEPSYINHGYLSVQESFVGWKFDMRAYTGEEAIYSVEKEDLKEIPVLEFYPYRNNDNLELRKVWKVPIQYNEGSFSGWLAFVDVMDGSLLNILPK